jgi:hypothetical protein
MWRIQLDAFILALHNGILAYLYQLLVTANAVPSSPILVTLMTEPTSSFETLALTRATRR